MIYVPKRQKEKEIPIWEKANLTLEEASAYTGIGVNKLRSISNEKKCKFVFWNGTKRMFKRKELDEFISKVTSV